jgi:uncharacterized damage-inducible protein DinB
MPNPLIETFAINNRINLYLLNAVDEQHLADVSPSKGRTVGEQFAHIHNVRLMWLQSAAPKLLEGLIKIEKGTISKQILADSLTASGQAMEKMLEESIAQNRVKGFKPHPEGFVGYIIAHESHHRGQINMILKLCGHAVGKSTTFGMWEWGTR